jgi:hypothetical protein
VNQHLHWYHGKINSQISYTSKNYNTYSMLTNHTETGSLSSNLSIFFLFFMWPLQGLAQQGEGTSTVGASSPWLGSTPHQGFMGLKLPSHEISIHMEKTGDKRRHITNCGPL